MVATYAWMGSWLPVFLYGLPSRLSVMRIMSVGAQKRIGYLDVPSPPEIITGMPWLLRLSPVLKRFPYLDAVTGAYSPNSVICPPCVWPAMARSTPAISASST